MREKIIEDLPPNQLVDDSAPSAQQSESAPSSVPTNSSERTPILRDIQSDRSEKVELVSIDVERMEEVADLEQRCYAHPWSRDLVRGEFQKDISARFGALLDNRLIAYCFTYIIPEEMHILNLAVAPELRGAGVGRKLLCHSLVRGIHRGVRLVSLEVRPSNSSAVALYSKLGFQRIAVRLNYYRDNGEDALILERKLGLNDIAFLNSLD
jgi:ribosomal-protein-alanine N-acetyltransferase